MSAHAFAPERLLPRAGATGRVLQRQPLSVAGARAHEAPPIVEDVLGSAGHPLSEATRAYFEPRLGHDFSGVRVHTNAKAAASAQAVQAEAYTAGSSIVFAAGKWSTAPNDGLLAHELVHVVQQSGGAAAGGRLAISDPHDAAEQEADAVARKVAAGGSTPPKITGAASGIQRKVVLLDVGKGEQSGFHRRDEIVTRLNGLKCGLSFILAGDGTLEAKAVEGTPLTEFGKQMLGFTDPAKATLPLRLTNREGLLERRPTANPGVYDSVVGIDAWSSGYVDVDDLLASSELGFQIALVHFLRERTETKNYAKRIGSPSLSLEGGPTPEFTRAHNKGLESELQVLRDFFKDPKIRVIDPVSRVYRTARNDTLRIKTKRSRGNAGRGIEGVYYEVVTRKDGKIHTPEEYLALLAAEAAADPVEAGEK